MKAMIALALVCAAVAIVTFGAPLTEINLTLANAVG